MITFQVVLDTNLLDSALRSNRGASFRLFSLVGASKRFEINLSVPLVLEYETVCMRHLPHTNLSAQDVKDVIDYLCSVGNKHKIHYLWRPILKDAKDDMVLELAIAAGADRVVTYNVRDLKPATQFGIQVMTPREFLIEIGVIK